MRLVCLFLLFIGYVLTLVTWPFYEQYTYFTNWTMHFTTVSIVLMYNAVNTVNFKNNLRQISTNHIFYSFAIPLNLIVVSLYWNLIHHKTIGKHREDGPWYKVVCQYWVHIVPAVCCLINTAISNIVLSRKPVKMYLGAGFAYCMLNYVTTRIIGEPLYSFMPWVTFMSTFKIVLLLLFFCAIAYLTLCKIDESLKSHLV